MRSRSGRSTLERRIEELLWRSRLVMVAAVAVTVLLSLGALVLATADAAYLVGLLGEYVLAGLDGAARDTLRTAIVTTIVKALDGFLIAALLVTVALGLYELFVNPLEPARGQQAAGRLLRVRDLEDLKQRVAKLVVLVLVVEFFQQALRLPVTTPLELLYLGAGVLVVSAALYVTGRQSATKAEPDADSS